MIQFLFSFIAIFSLPFLTFATDRDQEIKNLISHFPQTSVSTLSNGTRVHLPVLYHQIEALVAVGLVPLTEAANLMKKSGLYPAPVTKHKGLAIIYSVNHTSNSIGAYQEFVVLISATTNPDLAKSQIRSRFLSRRHLLSSLLYTSSDRQERNNEMFQFFVPWIHVSTQDALLAGREIWNLPKDLASFDFQMSGSTKTAAINSQTCKLKYGFSRTSKGMNLPLYMDFSLVGNWKPQSQKIINAPMFDKGQMNVFNFSSEKGDFFRPDTSTECGQWFAKTKFQPLVWQYVPRSGAILFQPSITNLRK